MSCFACLLVPGSLIHSALRQTTCLLIPFNAPPLSQVPSELDMLAQLLRSGRHLVAGRMSILDNEQRKHIARILNVSSRGNERVRVFFWRSCFRAYFLTIEQSAVDFPFCHVPPRWLIFPRHPVSSWLCTGKQLWPASSWSLKGVGKLKPIVWTCRILTLK